MTIGEEILEIRDTVIEAFEERFGSSPELIARAPGRVNLLGEHVDYNDGFVYPAAIDRATFVAFRPSGSNHSRIFALDLNDQISFSPISVEKKEDISGNRLPGWALYPAGIVFALQKMGLASPGMDAVFSSSVPAGSGLSSSASVEMGFCLAWKTLGKWVLEPLEMAKIGQFAEYSYVGVRCGIMDQFASMCGKKDHVLFLDCRSLEWEPLEIPKNIAIIIADTTIRHNLSSGAYNKNRKMCETAVNILNKYIPGLISLRDVNQGDFNNLSHHLPEEVAKKAGFVVDEIERTRIARGFLKTNDITRFGELMTACHNGLRDMYQVSCPELDTMVEVATSLPGCLGSRLTGAGFGGCTVSLVEENKAGSFMDNLARGYREKTGLIPKIFCCQVSDGACIL